jgi:hypothetical protein
MLRLHYTVGVQCPQFFDGGQVLGLHHRFNIPNSSQLFMIRFNSLPHMSFAAFRISIDFVSIAGQDFILSSMIISLI